MREMSCSGCLLVSSPRLGRGYTYNCPVRFVLIDAALKAGHAVESARDTHVAAATVAGIEAARTERITVVFIARRDVCWRR